MNVQSTFTVIAKLPQHHSMDYHGIPITVEWPKGCMREGTDRNGKPWRREMKADYGFIDDTSGAGDAEPIDIYIGPDKKTNRVFVIEQLNEAGEFDEYKLVAGVPDLETATQLYLAHYPKEWGDDRLGDCYETDLDSLRRKVEEHQEGGVDALPAKTAALLRLAYDKNFDLYIKQCIQQAGFPIDADMDWSKYLQVAMFSKLYPTDDPAERDEAIYHIITTELITRRILDRFSKIILKFPPDVRQLPLDKQVTEVLKKTFSFRTSEANNYILRHSLKPSGQITLSEMEENTFDEGTPHYLREVGMELYTDIDENIDMGGYAGREKDYQTGWFSKNFQQWLLRRFPAPTVRQYMRLLTLLHEELLSYGKMPKLKDIERRWVINQNKDESSRNRLDYNGMLRLFTALPVQVELYVRTQLQGKDAILPAVVRVLVRSGKAQLEEKLEESRKDRESRQQLVPEVAMGATASLIGKATHKQSSEGVIAAKSKKSKAVAGATYFDALASMS